MEKLTKEKKEKQYSYKEWCELIAWLINCDNKQFKFSETIYTADSCWHCNSHGELFGIMSAINFVKKIIENDLPKEDFLSEIKSILKGKILTPSKEKATGVGLCCVIMMWKCPPEFIAFAKKIIFREN